MYEVKVGGHELAHQGWLVMKTHCHESAHLVRLVTYIFYLVNLGTSHYKYDNSSPLGSVTSRHTGKTRDVYEN